MAVQGLLALPGYLYLLLAIVLSKRPIDTGTPRPQVASGNLSKREKSDIACHM